MDDHSDQKQPVQGIIRAAARRQWVVVDRLLATDGRLSWRARGLALWVLAQPDDWQIRTETLSQHATEGRDATRAAVRELEAAGYVERIRERRDDGTVVWHFVFHETAAVQPLAENPRADPLAGKPLAGKPLAENPRLPSNIDLQQHRHAGARAGRANTDTNTDTEQTPPTGTSAMPSATGPDAQATDLEVGGLVVFRTRGDHAALARLIEERGIDAVRSAARDLRSQGGRRCLVSAIEGCLVGPSPERIRDRLGALVAQRIADEYGVHVGASWSAVGRAAMAHRAGLMRRIDEWHRQGWLTTLSAAILDQITDGRRSAVGGGWDIEPLPAAQWDESESIAYAGRQIELLG